MGDVGSPMLLSRILAVLFLPSLFVRIGKCEYTKKYRTFFVFLMVYCVFSLAWTFNFSEGCKTIVYNFIHISLFFELIVFSRYANHPIKSISTGWTIITLCLLLIAVWEVVTGNHLPIAREEDQAINLGGVISQRIVATATFGNYNKFVTFLCFALPWIIYRISINYKKSLDLIITVITLILAILIILIDGSRGGLFTVVIIIGVYICFMPKNKLSYITLLLFIGGLLFLILRYSEHIFLVLSMKNENQGLVSDSSRIEIWTACFKALLNSIGLGSGVGGVSGAIESVSKNVISVPHNMIVEALLEYGIVFGIIFIAFIFKLLKKGFQLNDKNRRVAVLMAILSMPLYSIINSLYLTCPETFVLFATIFIFVNYELIKPICK